MMGVLRPCARLGSKSTFLTFFIVVVCVLLDRNFVKETDARHIALGGGARVQGERDSVIVEAVVEDDDETEDSIHIIRDDLHSIHSPFRKKYVRKNKNDENQHNQNQYYFYNTNINSNDESRLISAQGTSTAFLNPRNNNKKVYKKKKHAGSAFSRGHSFGGEHDLVDDEDPHFYQERYVSPSGRHRDENNQEFGMIKEDEDDYNNEGTSDELGRYSLVNSYFDNEYSLAMLNSMECVTPTKSKGYCSTFRSCVPSLFTPDGQLEAPALAELISFSIGFCTMNVESDSSSNVLMKRSGHRFAQVANRIICCPGTAPAPGTSPTDASVEKFNDFLSGKGPQVSSFNENDTKTPVSQAGLSNNQKPHSGQQNDATVEDSQESTAQSQGESINLDQPANQDEPAVATGESELSPDGSGKPESSEEKVEASQETPLESSEETPSLSNAGDKVKNSQDNIQTIPIEAFIPGDQMHLYDPHGIKFSEQGLENSKEKESSMVGGGGGNQGLMQGVAEQGLVPDVEHSDPIYENSSEEIENGSGSGQSEGSGSSSGQNDVIVLGQEEQHLGSSSGQPNLGQGQSEGSGMGENSSEEQGQGEGSKLGQKEGEGSILGQGPGEGSNLGQGQEEGSNLGQGQGEGSHLNQGQAEASGFGQNEGSGQQQSEGSDSAQEQNDNPTSALDQNLNDHLGSGMTHLEIEGSPPLSGQDPSISNGKPPHHGANSTIIKISPEPVIGANGKFTLEKGVHVEKATSETPRPKPNPAHQTQIGETTVNIIKTEVPTDSNPILILNNNKPVVGIKDTSMIMITDEGMSDETVESGMGKLPIFSSKIKSPSISSSSTNGQNSFEEIFAGGTGNENSQSQSEYEASIGFPTTTSKYETGHEIQHNDYLHEDIISTTTRYAGSASQFDQEDQSDEMPPPYSNDEYGSTVGNFVGDLSENFPTTTGRYFNQGDDLGSVHQRPTTTGRYSEEETSGSYDVNKDKTHAPTTGQTFTGSDNLLQHDDGSTVNEESTTRRYIGQGLTNNDISDGDNLSTLNPTAPSDNLLNDADDDSDSRITTGLPSESEEKWTTQAVLNEQTTTSKLGVNGDSTTLPNAESQDDDSFSQTTTLNGENELPEAVSTSAFPTTFDTALNDESGVESVATTLSTDEPTLSSINPTKATGNFGSWDSEAFPGSSDEQKEQNQNQLFLDKGKQPLSPASYEMQSVDDSAELHLVHGGGQKLKPGIKPLGLGGSLGGKPTIGLGNGGNNSPQVHEDDSLENAHDSPYPSNPNGWSIDQLYQQQNKPLNSQSLEDDAGHHNHLTTGTNNKDGQKVTNNQGGSLESDESSTSSESQEGSSEEMFNKDLPVSSQGNNNNNYAEPFPTVISSGRPGESQGYKNNSGNNYAEPFPPTSSTGGMGGSEGNSGNNYAEPFPVDSTGRPEGAQGNNENNYAEPFPAGSTGRPEGAQGNNENNYAEPFPPTISTGGMGGPQDNGNNYAEPFPGSPTGGLGGAQENKNTKNNYAEPFPPASLGESPGSQESQGSNSSGNNYAEPFPTATSSGESSRPQESQGNQNVENNYANPFPSSGSQESQGNKNTVGNNYAQPFKPPRPSGEFPISQEILLIQQQSSLNSNDSSQLSNAQPGVSSPSQEDGMGSSSLESQESPQRPSPMNPQAPMVNSKPPLFPTGSEVGGLNPQEPSAVQPEYQILSACATQDYYRSLEQDSVKQYPFLATIVGGSRPFCSGTLITDRHILTAAHFLSNITVSDVFHMRVHVGYRTGFGGQTEGPFAVRKVLKVIRHKNFSFDKLVNDIAILILDRPVRFSEDVHPVCLSNSPQLYSDGTSEAFETGWVEDPLMKKISPHHPFIDPHILKYFSFGYQNVTWNLQDAVTRVRTNEECQANYAFLEKSGITITDSMVCAQPNDNGKSCTFKGNSGAPLFLSNDGKPIQIGLVSWGIGCGHFPAVFTGVSSYLPWIEKVVSRTS